MDSAPSSAQRVDAASRVVRAPPARIYRAFVDPDALVRWLPPDGATAVLDRFEPRPGGRIRMTLTFDRKAQAGRAKTTANSDAVEGHFVDLVPDRRIVQAFTFVSDDPAYAGTMRMTWSLEQRDDGTEVTVRAEDVPEGIDADVHRAALAASLRNLAALVEGRTSDPPAA